MGLYIAALSLFFGFLSPLMAQSFELSSACGYPNSDAKVLKKYQVLQSFGKLTASESGDFSGAKIHVIKKGKSCQYSLEWAEGFPVSYLTKKQFCPKGAQFPSQLEIFEVQGQWAMGSKKGEKLKVTSIKDGLQLEMSGVKMKAGKVKTLRARDKSDLAGRILEANHLRACVQKYNKMFPKDTYLKYVVANHQNQINEKSKLPACRGTSIFRDLKMVKDPFRSMVIKELFSSTYNSDAGMQCLVDGYIKLSQKEQKQFLKYATDFFSKMDYFYPTGVTNYLYTLKKTTQVKKCVGKKSGKGCMFISDLLTPPKSFIQSAKKEAKKRKDTDSLKSINEAEKELKNFMG